MPLFSDLFESLGIYVKQKAEEAKPTLSNNFKRAAFGDFCRTLAFVDPYDLHKAGTWLEACADDTGWMITRCERLPSPQDEKNFTNRNVLVSGAPFFEVATHLSGFEIQQEQNARITTGPDIETLGHTHIRKFCEREALIFDIDGQVYPTNELGIPTVNAAFYDEDLEYARAAAIARAEKIKTLPVEKATSLSLSFKTSHDSIIPGPDRAPYLKEMRKVLDNMHEFTKNAEENHWASSAKSGRWDTESKKDCSDDIYFEDNFDNKSRKLYIKAVKSYVRDLSSAARGQAYTDAMRPFEMATIYANLSYLRDYCLNAPNLNVGIKGYSYSEKHSKRAIQTIVKCLNNIGFENIHAQSAAFNDFVRNAKDNPADQAAKIQSIITWFDAAYLGKTKEGATVNPYAPLRIDLKL